MSEWDTPATLDDDSGDSVAGEPAGEILLSYFGAIVDIPAEVSYAGEVWTATWHILQGADLDLFGVRLGRVPDALKPKAAKAIRIAMALVKVGARTVTFGGEDEEDEFLRRLQWIDRYPVPFIDAVHRSYEWAETRPAVVRRRMEQDPNTDAPRLERSGAFSATRGTSADRDANSRPTSGPTARSTPRGTRRTAARSGAKTS